ncbi:MAG: hypothetical protein AAGE37_04880 [Pseudomonadota bacterium]
MSLSIALLAVTAMLSSSASQSDVEGDYNEAKNCLATFTALSSAISDSPLSIDGKEIEIPSYLKRHMRGFLYVAVFEGRKFGKTIQDVNFELEAETNRIQQERLEKNDDAENRIKGWVSTVKGCADTFDPSSTRS